MCNTSLFAIQIDAVPEGLAPQPCRVDASRSMQDDDEAYAVQHDAGRSLTIKTLLIGNYRTGDRRPVII